MILTRITIEGDYMERYRNIDGDSGVHAYEYGEDYIRVQFSTGSVYLYTSRSAGNENIQQMKRLAISGDGLNKFINQVVRRLYETKER